MKSYQTRQGDVFTEQTTREVPKDAAPIVPDAGRSILAYGEVTGHAHALPGRVKMFRAAGEPTSGVSAYLKIDGLPETLRHEEHGHFDLPSGTHGVTIQREYSPEEIRNVQD